jgi:arsenate reductase
MDIDGFSIAVCAELGIELARHKSRSFAEMHKMGDELSSFDLIVALSPASQIEAEKITNFYDLKTEYWPIFDPTGAEDDRDKKLMSYRKARDQIINNLTAKFGSPNH